VGLPVFLDYKTDFVLRDGRGKAWREGIPQRYQDDGKCILAYTTFFYCIYQLLVCGL
jgi:hypothetical protein